MRHLVSILLAAALAASLHPLSAAAETIAFKLLPNYSRATFKADAPLETIVGNTAGDGVTGALSVDPAKPGEAKGTIKVDLATLNTGVAKRDDDMRSPRFLDTAKPENRYAVFEIKRVEIEGPLEPGKDVPARVTGVLTIKGKSVTRVAETRVTWIKLAPEQIESQKRFGFASDNIKVRGKLATTLSDHEIPVPQVLMLKLSNDLSLEVDLTFVRQ